MLKRALHKNLGVPRDRKRRKRDSVSGVLRIDLCTEASGFERKRKRGELSMIDKNVKLKQTKGTVNSNGVEIRVEGVDYISHLPETVIHLILSLLRSTKDAARTSTLSKRWRDLWTSFSVLAFDQRKFQKPEGVKDKKKCNAMFKEFVDKSLQSHFDHNLGIYKLVLHVNSFDQDMAHRIEKWIGLAVENKTKEIGFHAHKKICGRYTVPRNVFASETITGLRLEGCRVDTSSNIKLPNLQKLYLRKIHFDESIIINLITSCPLINDLRLVLCSGLNNLQISSLLKLYRVEVHYCHGLAMIEIKAPSLETFWFCGKKYMSCKIKLVACESLKRLTLEDSRMTDNQFRDRFFRFPLLEKLDLHKCLNLKNIRIASHRLKRLVLRGCKKLADVEIDTPNLLSFEYEGDEMPFSFLNPVSLKEAKLSFAPVRNFISEPEWFLKMREFLGKLDHRAFKLVVYTNKNVIIHENIREILLPPNCGLKFELIQSSVGTEELLDSSLQKRQLETLSLVSSSSSEFLKLVREKITRKEDPTCCTSMNSTNKCWRHFLKDARMVNLKAAKHVAPWMAWLKSHARVNEITCFRLKWKSDKDGGKRKTTVGGPWGGNGGTHWEDGIYDGVREITVVYGHCIDSITVVYDNTGKSVKADTHGGRGGTQTADVCLAACSFHVIWTSMVDLNSRHALQIKLEYPDECLVSVTGNYCLLAYGGTAIIRSLKFQSNRRTFGPFGIEEDTTFTYNVEGGKIVGLKGRNGWYRDAIGFHVSPAPTKLFWRVQKSFRRLGSPVTFGHQRN